jgi:hypothetical protein
MSTLYVVMTRTDAGDIREVTVAVEFADALALCAFERLSGAAAWIDTRLVAVNSLARV